MSGVVEVTSGAVEVPRLFVPHGEVYECPLHDPVTDMHLGKVVRKLSRDLKPFDYHSSQVQLAGETAYSIISDPAFASRESVAIAMEMRQGRKLRMFGRRYTVDRVKAAAEARFGQRVAPTIAHMMALVASGNAKYRMAFFEPDLSAEESLRLARAQIDKVDLCQLQVYNTIIASRIRDVYVENVATRVERILAR